MLFKFITLNENPVNRKIKFGTDGIRGKADQFPFIPEPLRALGLAIAQWATKKYNKSNPNDVLIKILLGHDTRISCENIKKNLVSGLGARGVRISDAGVIPTPAVLQLIEQSEENFDFGIVISASHNPYTDNGIKLFDANTGKISAQDENDILQNFEKLHENVLADLDKAGVCEPYEQASCIYIKNIVSKFSKNFLNGKKIVLDCANGATHKIAPEIFSSLGAKVISLNTQPDGRNINRNSGALHTEQMQQAVLEHNADIGFAFDGDGDRVIAANKSGEYRDGDDLLAILLEHKDFQNEKVVVGTIMTNHGFEQHLKKNGKELVRTKVGDKYVAAHLEKENLMVGGEASGHVIIKNYLNTGDGIFVALKVLESIIQNNNSEFKTFTKTPQHMINVPVSQKKPLDQEPFVQIINNHGKMLENGRIIVRYSGTENLLRIMAEDQTKSSAQNVAKELSIKLQNALGLKSRSQL
jgi:phosphoglucosamine mutase